MIPMHNILLFKFIMYVSIEESEPCMSYEKLSWVHIRMWQSLTLDVIVYKIIINHSKQLFFTITDKQTAWLNFIANYW